MKIFITTTFLISLFCASAHAQPFSGSAQVDTSSIVDLQFVPQTPIQIGSSTSVIYPQTPVLNRQSNFLLSVLDGIKYASVYDRFNAINPFDQRAYEAVSFSDLTHHAERYQFIQSAFNPVIW